jgi:hypothetical protein
MDKDWTFNLNTSFEKYQKFCSNFSQIKWKYVRKRVEGRGIRQEARGRSKKALGTRHKV